MITISSKSGQRLARAKASIDAWRDRSKDGMGYAMARVEYAESAAAVADELIAGRHDEVEGD